MNKNLILLSVANIIFPLIVGSIIYYLFQKGIIIPSLIKNYLPDTLWFYSFTFSILLLKQYYLVSKWVFITFIVTPLLFEFFQNFGFIPGTFDVLDIIVYYIGGTTAYVIFNLIRLTNLLKSTS